MAEYKSYMHVERLDTEDCEGILDNDRVFVTSKIDGTNACVFLDKQGNLCGGSRKKKLSLSDDNAKFMNWLKTSDCDQVNQLKQYLTDNPVNIIYGEWLGQDKFIGHIKSYDSSCLSHLWIFDVYDTEQGYYLPDNEWRYQLSVYGLSDYFVDILEVLDHPSYILWRIA